MKRKTKKIILISFLLLLACSVSVAVYLYNKGPLDVKSSRAVAVDAKELYAVFTGDSAKANKKYTSRVLLVNGEVSDVSVNSKQQKIILIKTGVDGAYVNCTLEDINEVATPSGRVSVKGICSGIGEGDADLGIPGDVYLTRCLITANK